MRDYLSQPAILVLADGTVFEGVSVGFNADAIGEVVFNTAMTGYQEILTDPSYAQQIINFTQPHIGNVGCNSDDQESLKAWAAGFIVRRYSPHYANWRASESLQAFCEKHRLSGIAEVDTRQLTHHLRTHGAQAGCITTEVDNLSAAIDKAKSFPGLRGCNVTHDVSCQKSYAWTDGVWQQAEEIATGFPQYDFEVVVIDFGVKFNILRLLKEYGCAVTVVPATTPAADIIAKHPHAVLLSNGPGDPAACEDAIATIRQLIAQEIPLFGICLGYQLLALALGANTVKMSFGHHGANHPVFDATHDSVMITSQNHSFCVTFDNLPDCLVATHHSLFDNTLQGFRHKNLPIMGFQGHPEASPGPHDVINGFNEFLELVSARRQ